MAFEIKSAAFQDGGPIPPKHAFSNGNASPGLSWSSVPEGTKSIALICDDPDAPMKTWVHWVVYNIPANETGLIENIPKDKILDSGAMQGTTDFRSIGYGGPAPPPGSPHRYFFKLYALDKELDLEPGAAKDALLKAMEGHMIEEAQIMGTFER